MTVKSSSTEIFFLKIFKTIILLAMGLALLISIGMLIFAGIQYSQTPKEPIPAKSAPEKSVSVEDFLKTLEKPSDEPHVEKNAEKSPKKPVSKPIKDKYKDEVSRVYGCYLEARKRSGLQELTEIEEKTETLRGNIENVADSADHNRGQPYVNDLVRVGCEIMAHPKLIEYLKTTQNAQVFITALNFHLKAWDKLKADILAFESSERQRVEKERVEEDLRVAAAKQQSIVILMISGGAFAVFMALALYLIFSAIESSLRSVSESLSKISQTDPTSVVQPDFGVPGN